MKTSRKLPLAELLVIVLIVAGSWAYTYPDRILARIDSLAGWFSAPEPEPTPDNLEETNFLKGITEDF